MLKVSRQVREPTELNPEVTGMGTLFPEVNQPVREVVRSPPYSAEVKNELSYSQLPLPQTTS
jgi:hypothetical protein